MSFKEEEEASGYEHVFLPFGNFRCRSSIYIVGYEGEGNKRVIHKGPFPKVSNIYPENSFGILAMGLNFLMC